jgi:hypothetical protein
MMLLVFDMHDGATSSMRYAAMMHLDDAVCMK